MDSLRWHRRDIIHVVADPDIVSLHLSISFASPILSQLTEAAEMMNILHDISRGETLDKVHSLWLLLRLKHTLSIVGLAKSP
jgi:hypothetical protein